MTGAKDLQLPEDLREKLHQHIADLRQRLQKRGWGSRTGFGQKPAVVVIDLAEGWLDSKHLLGSNLESVLTSTRKVLDAARAAEIPIFFTTVIYDQDDPWSPWDLKRTGSRAAFSRKAGVLDPHLERRPNEKLIVKKYWSSFKATDFWEMLAGLGVDTLIVTGCSTSHCVHATCLDAAGAFRVIVPEEAVGDRCELYHLVYLLDIAMTLADVIPTEEVVAHLKRMPASRELLLRA